MEVMLWWVSQLVGKQEERWWWSEFNEGMKMVVMLGEHRQRWCVSSDASRRGVERPVVVVAARRSRGRKGGGPSCVQRRRRWLLLGVAFRLSPVHEMDEDEGSRRDGVMEASLFNEDESQGEKEARIAAATF
jgi:hypothetical protein